MTDEKTTQQDTTQPSATSKESETPFSDGLLEVPPSSPLDRRDSLLQAIGDFHKANRKTVRAKRGPAS